MLDKLTKDDFSPCLHEAFRIHVEGGEAIDAELTEIRELVPPDDEPDRRRPFSLIFEGPPDAPLQQGIHRLENATLGEMELFLVTLGPSRERMRHEAVFT